MFQAMILAAGLGTRLRPITNNIPKALIEVKGKPLLWHVIKRLHDIGAQNIVVNVCHHGTMIVDYLKENAFWGLDIRISEEGKEPLGTGGGIKNAQRLFLPNLPILIHNVDIFSDADLLSFCNVSEDASALLLVSDRLSSRKLLFDNTMHLTGWTNIETGEVRMGKREKQIAFTKSFSGIHLFHPRLFSLMDCWPKRFEIMDFYLSICDKEKIKGYCVEALNLLDVGKIEALSKAEKFLSDMGINTK